MLCFCSLLIGIRLTIGALLCALHNHVMLNHLMLHEKSGSWSLHMKSRLGLMQKSWPWSWKNEVLVLSQAKSVHLVRVTEIQTTSTTFLLERIHIRAIDMQHITGLNLAFSNNSGIHSRPSRLYGEHFHCRIKLKAITSQHQYYGRRPHLFHILLIPSRRLLHR